MAEIVFMQQNEKKYGEGEGAAKLIPRAPQWIDQVSVTNAVSATYTIPTDASYVILNGPGNWWITPNTDAVVPAADITDGTGSAYNQTQLDVRGLISLGIIGDDSFHLTIAVYK